MPQANYKLQGWRAPIELRAHRTGLIAFGAVALLLLMLGRAENSVVEKLRMEAAEVASGVLQAGSDVAAFVSRSADAVSSAAALYKENQRLKAQNAELLTWRERAIELQRRVSAFESVMAIAYASVDGVTTASVIADTSGPFARAVIVNAGRKQGVRNGDAALDRMGLVGRVVATGDSSARVLLLTDTTSHVPVVMQPGGIKAILSGDADGLPQLDFMPTGTQLKDGAEIVTSGDGGVIPPGLPVGRVQLRGARAPVALLYADIARVDVVALKRYDFIDDVDAPPLPAPNIAKPAEPPPAANVAANPVVPH